jgi:DNA-binding response OmpR family regulator
MLTLGLALPSAPPLAPYHVSVLMDLDASEAPDDSEVGAASSLSLPLARQRQVALVAHADPRMARYLRANLDRAGYHALTAADLAVALRQIDAEEPDVILLDAALPADPPHDPLQRALARTSAPVILLTREASPASAALALDAGAADVIAMPLSVEETLARVRRALRLSPHTAHGAHGGRVTVCGDLVIDETERRVTLAGAPIALSKIEYRLLRVLARNAGKTISHATLLEQVWGPAYRQEIEFIWVHIRRLRRKIEPDPSHPRYIQTAPGVGYHLASPTPARAGL